METFLSHFVDCLAISMTIVSLLSVCLSFFAHVVPGTILQEVGRDGSLQDELDYRK